MQKFILAVQFFTRLPTPQLREFRPEWLADAARWFPLVGLLLGGLLLALIWPASLVDPWLAAWAGLLGWALLTGGLHLDGLADLADALGAAHRDRERFLAVLKDPHLGSFGVLTLILQLAGKLVLLMLAVRNQAWLGLLLIPAWARLGVLYWQTLPPVSAGMGEQFGWRVPYGARRGWLVLLALLSLWQAPPLLLAPLLIWLYRRWLLRAVGGMTGDCLGAGVDVVETGLLLATGLAAVC